MTNDDTSSAKQPHAQTLSRGLRVLEILADSEPLTIAELATALDVHRSIAYRILRTLEDHRLVIRDAGGRVQLGPRLAALASSVNHDLQAAALPELTTVANELAMTAFLVTLDATECVTLVSVEPANIHAAVAQRPGSRHSLAVGAPGLAIQSRLPEDSWSALGLVDGIRPEAELARRRGYATSEGEVIKGLRSVACPLMITGQAPAAVAVVYVATDIEEAELGARLARATKAIESGLS